MVVSSGGQTPGIEPWHNIRYDTGYNVGRLQAGWLASREFLCVYRWGTTQSGKKAGQGKGGSWLFSRHGPGTLHLRSCKKRGRKHIGVPKKNEGVTLKAPDLEHYY